jgi:hypothetical protein
MANAKVSFVRSYRDLVAWQKAMALVTNVYRYTDSFPKAEIYGLSGASLTFGDIARDRDSSAPQLAVKSKPSCRSRRTWAISSRNRACFF